MGRYLELEPESSLGWENSNSPRHPVEEVPAQESEKPAPSWVKPAMLALFSSCALLLVMKWGSVTTPIPSSIPTTTFEAKHSEIMVYVAGEVKNPGVVRLNAGSRVTDAIKAAGGFSEKANQVAINLAAKVHDEEMIRVPAIGEAPEPDASASPGVEASATPYDAATPEFPKAPPGRPVDVQAQITPAAPATGHFEGGVVDAIESRRTATPRNSAPDPGSAPVPHPPAPPLTQAPAPQLTPAAMMSPGPAESPAPRPSATPRVAANPPEPPANRVSINRATADQLEKVPGLTPKMASDIVNYRKGPPPRAFTSLDELEKIPSLRQAQMNEVMPNLKL